MVLPIIVVALALGADAAQSPSAGVAGAQRDVPQPNATIRGNSASAGAATGAAPRYRRRGYLSLSHANRETPATVGSPPTARSVASPPTARSVGQVSQDLAPPRSVVAAGASPRLLSRPPPQSFPSPGARATAEFGQQIEWPWAAESKTPNGFPGKSAVEQMPTVGVPLSRTADHERITPPAGTLPPGPPAVPPAAIDELSFTNYYNPFSRQLAYGNAGAQPYHLGWYFYDEVTWMPAAAARGVGGSFQDLQYNTWARYSRPFLDGLLFTWTPTWNTSFWTGPTGVNLPGSVDQLVSDLQIASAYRGPWNFQIGFTPQINSDFRKALNSNAYMFDGRFVLFYQASPNLRLAAGAAYWNRVHDFFIPYGGVIWSPDDHWEVRLFFPKTRISRYWGEHDGKQVWTYASIGYDVEAWQVTIQNEVPYKTRMQMSAIELLLGASAHRDFWTAYIEAGLIFDRHVLFRDNTPSFGINDSLVLRVGALY